VFLDIGLPVMDGYELAAHLRALEGLNGVTLIALTGYGQGVAASPGAAMAAAVVGVLQRCGSRALFQS
jgi:CheY-like chemotaxis protein